MKLLILLLIFIPLFLCQQELLLDTFTVLLPSNSSCSFDGCGTAPPTFTPDDNVCVVNGGDFPVDCSCLANDTMELPPDPCPGCPTNETVGRKEFSTVQEALMRCPYDPLILELTGTHTVNRLMFPDREGLVYLRGYITELIISNCSEVESEQVITQFQNNNPGLNFTHLLNVTYSRVPVQNEEPVATLVGSKWKVLNPNTSLTFENITVHGCCTTDPLFQLCGWEDVDPSLNGCCDRNLTLPQISPSPTPQPDPCIKTGDFIDNCMSELGFRMDCERWYTEPGGCIMNGVYNPSCPAQPTTLFNCSSSENGTVSGVWSCVWEDAWMRLVDCKFRVDPDAPFIQPTKPPGSCINCETEEVEIFKPCDPPEIDMKTPQLCRGCLINNNITLLNTTIQDFKGQYVLKGYALEDNVNLHVEDSNFVDIPGHALYFEGLNRYTILNNCYARCGGLTESCLYLKANFISRDVFQFASNHHYLTERTLDFPCEYSLNGEVLCNNGVLQCLDFVNTTLNDCDFSTTPFGDVIFNEDCSVYTNCSCEPQNLTLAFNFTLPTGAGEASDVVGDGIIVDVLFDLSGLDLPFEQGDEVFFPCAATETTPGANMTLNPNLSLDDIILGAQLCPVFENTTNTGNCTEFMSCACPASPCDRASQFCDELIQEGLRCQNGRGVCANGLQFENFTVNMEGDIQAMLSGEANNNGSTGGQRCEGPALLFCTCPALNVSSYPNGSVVSVQTLPQEGITDDTILVGGNFSGLMWIIQTSYNFSVGGSGDAGFSCQEGRVRCDCNSTITSMQEQEGLCYDINNCSKAFHLDNVPDSAEHFRIFNNVAEGLPIGLHIERISYDLVARSSYKVPRFFSDVGTLHEIVRQNNQAITGTVNDTISGRKDFWKFMVCNDGCPMHIPRELVDACGVDQRFNADTLFIGIRRFSRIVPAIRDCPFDSIIVHRSINVYEEQIIFNRTNLYFLTLNSAVILRSNHTIAADNCTVQGFIMIHPAENQLPLLRPNSASIDEFSFLNFDLAPNLDTVPPKNFSALNNIMKGNSVAEAGTVVGEFGHSFVFRYNTIENFLSRAVDVFAPDPDVSFNYFDTVFGRSMRLRGTFSYFSICNTFVNCRGLAEGSGVDIVSYEAFDIFLQFGAIAAFDSDETVTETEETSLSSDEEEERLDSQFGDTTVDSQTCNATQFCFVAGNVQRVDENVRDLSDTFIRFVGGGIQPRFVRDNAASKAQTGIYFLWMRNITFESRYEVYRYNPLIRVEDVQTDFFGSDFLFRRPGSLIDLECSYPDCRDFTADPAAFVVNKNFGHLITPFYGFNEYNNVSAADRYASLLHYTNVTHVDYAIRVSQVNGSRLSREQIILRRPIAYFGDLFPCGLKPAIYGSGHEIDTWYANATDMEYRYDDYAPLTGLQLWLTPLFSRVFTIIFHGCCFVGRYQNEAGRIHIADFSLQENNGTFIFTDNLIYDWYHLREDVKRLNRKRMVEGRPVAVLQMEDGSERQLDLVGSTSGFYVKWHKGIIIPRTSTFDTDLVQQVKQNLTTLAVVNGNHFFDIDGRALSIENVHSFEIQNNSLINVGMRRDSDAAGIFASGLLDSNGSYVFNDNFYNQTRSMLFPQVGTIKTTPGGTSGGAPTHFAAYWLHQMCNATVWQFKNNTAVVFVPQDPSCERGTETFTTNGVLDSCAIRGADYGVRFSSICNHTFFLNIPENEPVFFPEFRPEQVGLRQLALQDNEDVDGTVCDMILCEPFSDIFWSTRSFRRDCTCCRNGCRVPPPNRCIVDRDNSTFIPGNPFLGSYFFTSLNDAVVNCSAPSRIIEVRKQSTPYVEPLVLDGEGFFFISGTENVNSVFTESDASATIPNILWPAQTLKPGLDNNAVFRTANVKINAPALIFQNIHWQHNGAGPTITTDMNPLSNVTFLNNTFEGEGTYQPALKGNFLNITLTGNSWKEYAGPFAHDVASGCTEGFLTMTVNSFRRLSGQIRYVDLNAYLVRSNIFVNSGCRHAGPNSMLLLRACLDGDGNVLSHGPMRFEDNASLQPDSSGIIEMPDGVGYCATYYLDGVPNNQSGCYAFRNSAEGLPVGMRVDHVPDQATNDSSIIGSRPQLTLQLLYALCANAFVNGTWHSLVNGPPENDPDIMNDPIQNMAAVCDNGCPYEQNYWGLVLIFFPIFLIVFCCCAIRIARSRKRVEYVYSAALQRNIPKDKSLWMNNNYEVDARTGEIRSIDGKKLVSDSERAAARYRQIRRETEQAMYTRREYEEIERDLMIREVESQNQDI